MKGGNGIIRKGPPGEESADPVGILPRKKTAALKVRKFTHLLRIQCPQAGWWGGGRSDPQEESMIRANGILMTWLLIHTAQTEAGGEEGREGKGRERKGSTVSSGGKAAVKRLLIKASHGQLDK